MGKSANKQNISYFSFELSSKSTSKSLELNKIDRLMVELNKICTEKEKGKFLSIACMPAVHFLFCFDFILHI